MKKNFLLKTIAIGLVLVACVSLAGCSGIKESDVSYAGPIIDNILAGIKDKDYSEFSRDFSDTLKDGIPEDSFNTEIVDRFQALGELKEKLFASAANAVENNVNYTVVIYKVKYEKADVQLQISFSDSNGKKLIEGLYYK